MPWHGRALYVRYERRMDADGQVTHPATQFVLGENMPEPMTPRLDVIARWLQREDDVLEYAPDTAEPSDAPGRNHAFRESMEAFGASSAYTAPSWSEWLPVCSLSPHTPPASGRYVFRTQWKCHACGMTAFVLMERDVLDGQPFQVCPHVEMCVHRGDLSMRRHAALTAQDIWAEGLWLATAALGEQLADMEEGLMPG